MSQPQTPTHLSDTKPVLPLRQVADSAFLIALNCATSDKLPRPIVAILAIRKVERIHSPTHRVKLAYQSDRDRTITEGRSTVITQEKEGNLNVNYLTVV